MNIKKIIGAIILACIIFSFNSVEAKTKTELEKQIKDIKAQIEKIQSQKNSSVTRVTDSSKNSNNKCPTIPTFNFGDTDAKTGGKVSEVQSFLKSQGLFTYNSITGYYGSFTDDAVKRYRIKCASLAGLSTSPDAGNDGVDLDLILSNKTIKPGETILIKATIENNSTLELTGPKQNCSGISISFNKNINGRVEPNYDCYDYFGDSKEIVSPGQKKTYNIRFTVDRDSRDDGKYTMTVKFPGGYELSEKIEIDNIEEEINTDVDLDKESYKAGESVNVRAVVVNNTREAISGNLNSCGELILSIANLTGQTRKCSISSMYDFSIFGPKDKANVGPLSQGTFYGTFVLATTTPVGTYKMTVKLPNNKNETKDVVIVR